MKYPTEAEIAAYKEEAGAEMDEYKKNRTMGHLSIAVLLVCVCGLVACTAALMNNRPTPTPPAVANPPIAISTAVPPAASPSMAASPTPFVTSTFPPTWTPVYWTPLPLAAPATMTPWATYTAAPTYTPPPTWTPPATATERPTQTPQATYTPLATLTPLATYTPPATWTPAPVAGTAENASPLPDAVYWILASLACLLALAAAVILLTAARRTAVQPPAIIIPPPAPRRLPRRPARSLPETTTGQSPPTPPTPRLVFLRQRPVRERRMVAAPVEPVQPVQPVSGSTVVTPEPAGVGEVEIKIPFAPRQQLNPDERAYVRRIYLQIWEGSGGKKGVSELARQLWHQKSPPILDSIKEALEEGGIPYPSSKQPMQTKPGVQA